MKKLWVFIVVIISFSFCFSSMVAAEEEKSSRNHGLVHNEIENYKKPVKWEVVLIDERTDEEEVIVLNEYGYFSNSEGLDEDLLAQFAAKLARNIDQPMRNPTISPDGKIIPGQKQVILSEKELVSKIQELDVHDQELILPIYEKKPTVSEEQLIGILDVNIGTYSTHFNPSVEGRSVNIKLSADSIQHYVLGPGDEFSFNKVVGQRTVERGYREAKEIVNKEFVMGIGGGICQTSSTLFNAIDAAGLQVVERYSHSREIGYVPANRDATVSWGGPDFVFSNPYNFPVILKTHVSLNSGKITVEVFSSQNKEQLVASIQ
ncbi:VanW family protein [Alkalihalobacterium alkalinitrilicum]|uniref:VanW family protein n=1 Tax=Alkalihalobacterium alkalinitrilicum TaxID=427920 RepID=UPI001EE4E4EE|nr:VanW family protein [Alkalihalobacterium alkalinitrilicum]